MAEQGKYGRGKCKYCKKGFPRVTEWQEFCTANHRRAWHRARMPEPVVRGIIKEMLAPIITRLEKLEFPPALTIVDNRLVPIIERLDNKDSFDYAVRSHITTLIKRAGLGDAQF